MTPRPQKSGYGLILGCRLSLDAGPFEKFKIDDVQTNELAEIRRKNLHRPFWSGIAIDRAWSTQSGARALDVRES